MMRRTGLVISVLAAVTLLVAGCDILSINFFDGFGAPETPSSVSDVEKMAAEGKDAFVASILDLTNDAKFYTDLVGQSDRTVVSAITAELSQIYGDLSVDIAVRQQAAILAADLELNTTDAAIVVESVSSAVIGLATGATEGTSGDAMRDVVTTVIDSAFTDVPAEDFAATLDALREASTAFTSFGNTLADSGVQADINIGDVALNAVVSIAIVAFVDEFATQTGQQPESAEQLIAMIDSSSDPTDPDYLTAAAIVNNSVSSIDQNAPIDAIITEAGLGDLLGGAAS